MSFSCAPDRIGKRDFDVKTKFLLCLQDIGHVAIAGCCGVSVAKDLDSFAWSKDISYEVSKLTDADYSIGAYVVCLA